MLEMRSFLTRLRKSEAESAHWFQPEFEVAAGQSLCSSQSPLCGGVVESVSLSERGSLVKGIRCLWPPPSLLPILQILRCWTEEG